MTAIEALRLKLEATASAYALLGERDLPALLREAAAALTPPEGHVVVTRDESGRDLAVTRQDDEGRILSVIPEFEPVKGDMGNPISIPEGYVLVPVEPTEAMLDSCGVGAHGVKSHVWAAMLAARPEVP